MRRLLTIFLFVTAFTALNAQDSLRYKEANFYSDSAQAALTLKNYDTACKYASLHLGLELSFKKPREARVMASYIVQALCEFREGRYKNAIEKYNGGLKWIDKNNSASFSKAFFQFVDLCYMMLETQDSVFYEYSDKDFRKSFTVSIKEVLWREGNKFRVKLNLGLNDGLENGVVAYPISLSTSEGEAERKFQLGKGEIVKINAWSSEAELVIYDETDTLNWIRKGDLVETRILSKFKEETTIYKLLANSVTFKNNYKKDFVNDRYIIHYDSKDFQEMLLLIMANQVAETEEFTREGDTFLKPATEGQNKGKSIHDLFLKVDTNDIHDFLEFVYNFPRKYIGKPYPINETYATWLLNNSPSTPGVILDSLLMEGSLQRQLEILEFNKSDLNKAFYTTWADRADEFAEKQNFMIANKAAKLILLAANFLNNNDIRAYGYFHAGKIFKKQSLYNQAILHYDSAAATYLGLRDTLEYARSIYKKGDSYSDWGKYNQAIDNYNIAEKILKTRIGNSSNYGENNLLAYILWNKGYTISEKGDNVTAVKAYDEAGKILSKIGGSKYDRGVLLRNIAYVLKKQGQYEKALDNYRKSGTLFYAAGYVSKYARAFDDLADTYFKMGKYRRAIKLYTDAYDLKLSSDDKSGAGFSKSNIGQAYWNLGDYDSALLSHREAVELRKAGNDVVGTAYSYEKIANLWKETGNVDSALHFYQASEKLYISNNDTTDKLADIKQSVGTLFYDLKNYDKAIQYYTRALALYRRIDDGAGIANGLYNLGLCHYGIKSYNTAEKYLLEAKEKYEQMEDKESIMYSLINLSLVQWVGANNFQKAEKLMAKALILAKESNSLTNQGYTFNQLGVLKQSQGYFVISKQYYDSSLLAYKESGDYSGMGYTNINIGDYYINKGEFSKSQQLYLQVANEAIEKKNYLLASSAYNNLADYYNLTGEYDSAIYIANLALGFNRELKNEYTESGNYISLGNTYNYLANYKEAVKYYYKADSIYKAIKDPFSRATAVNNIGTIYFHQGDYRKALIQFNDVYELLTKINYQGNFLVLALSNIGEVYLEDGLLTEAEKWLKISFITANKTGDNRGQSGMNLLLGKLKLKQQKYGEAKAFLRAAYTRYAKIGEKERIIEASTFLGKLYNETSQTDSAVKYLTIAINTAKQTGNTRYQWEPLYISSTINLKQRDTAKAVNQLKEAVDILENIKGNIAGNKKNLVSFSKAQDKYKLYRDLVELLVAQNDVKAAFFYQEKANITGLLEQTRGGDNGPTRSNELLGGLEEETVAQELELKIDGYYAELIKERSKPQEKQSADKIKTLKGLIDVNETNYQEFIDSAMTASGNEESNNFSTTINPRQLDDARFSLSDKDAVIEYLATENQLLIFVATNNSLNVRKVSIKKQELTTVINSFKKQLETYKTEKDIVLKNSTKLYQIFISPIEDLLVGRSRLALVPTGFLYNLPVQALGQMENGKMEYLIAKYDITYINNIKFIYQAQGGRKLKLKIVAFGNADKTLSNAENEVKNIASIFPETTIFIQDSATEDKAKLMINDFNVVHFAIHGRLDPITFANSYLALAPNAAAGDDGKLTMSEIRKIRSLRNVKLLVLSACNTAVKDEKHDNWLNTPANVFIIKGVGSVIATQWQVHDEATGELMKHFYTNLEADMTFSAALKKAQLSLSTSEKFSHPYYWSAFETIGKW